MPAAVLSVVFEFARAEQAGDPFAFRFVPQEYLLRGAGGGFDSSQLQWNEALLADLAAVGRAGCDGSVLQRLGGLLQRFLAPLGWAQQEQLILEACQQERPVILTFRSAAAELYALPWELLTIQATGQHLGELPTVLIRYEWPETATAREQPTPRTEPGRILLAWSAAAGAVPAAKHLEAIANACRAGFYPFAAERDVLPSVSPMRLSETLAAAQYEGAPISVLHILCHGTAIGATFGLALDGEEEGAEPAVVDAGRLRQLLHPYAGMLRLVVLMACDGSNPGAWGNQLGSVAQTLHRAGIAAVVASRYPLSSAGSVRLAEELYSRLLVNSTSLESALRSARDKLAQDTARSDWASVQLYARAGDGDDTRPVVFRPYRGLAAFVAEDHRFYFGRARDVQRIIKRLHRGARLVTVVGASGSGKSSLLLAGVVPALAAGELGSAAPRVCVVRPGAAPCQALAAAVAQQAKQTPAGTAAELASSLLGRREALAEFAARCGPGPLLLIVDQAEELFLLADRREASAFIDNFLYATSVADGNVITLLTLRADFLGLCLERPALAEQVRATMTLVLPMTRAELREGIIGPAELVGLKFEEGLVDALLDAILDTGPEAASPSAASHPLTAAPASAAESGAESSSASSAGTLPLLQFTLEQLWERRSGNTISWESWRAIGGVRGAIARRADEVLAVASQAGEQTAVRQLFGRLVHLGEGTVDTRRRARREEVEAIAPGQMQPVLGRWVEARMITVDDGEVTLAHEALLREWGTLRRWIDGNREALRTIQALSQDARRYRETGENSDDLWRGTPLRRALDLQAAGRLPLAPAEAEFLRRSAALAARQQALAEEQQRQAQDRDLGRGEKPRTLAILLLVCLGTFSYYLGLLHYSRLTQKQLMAQSGLLAAVGGSMIYLLRKKLAANRINRQLFGACYVALIPLFINHFLGWKFNWPVDETQVFSQNIFLSMALCGMIFVDSRLWKLALAFVVTTLISSFLVRYSAILFGVVMLFGCLYVLLIFRSRGRSPL